MKIVEQNVNWLIDPVQCIESAGRTCYKSEDKMTAESEDKFIKSLINRGHEAMIEFGWAAMRFITNRGVTHEMVRHRLFSFAQESTRYVNYNNKEMEFIKPVWSNNTCEQLTNFRNSTGIEIGDSVWCLSMQDSESYYNELIGHGQQPQQAREVLPNSLKTEICVAGNFREWRHFFKLRCSPKAHPQMKDLADQAFMEWKAAIAVGTCPDILFDFI